MSRACRERFARRLFRANHRPYVSAAVIFTSAFVTVPGNATLAGNETLVVLLKNHRFEPEVVRVEPGQTIRFDNADDALHSLTLIGHENVIGEEFVDPGQSYTLRIPAGLAPGTYELACTIHVDMRGQLSVSENLGARRNTD